MATSERSETSRAASDLRDDGRPLPGQSHDHDHLSLSAAGVRRLLLFVALGLSVISIGGQFAKRIWPDVEWLQTASALLNVSSEQTLPTLIASLGLLGLAILAWTIGTVQGRHGASPWWGRVAAAVPAYMAADEFLMLHERTIAPLRRLFGTGGGWLHYAWVVPALVLVLLTVIIGYRWLTTLGAPARRRTLLGAAIFVVGAVGLEMLAGWLVSGGHTHWLLLNSLSTVEEFLEMAGVAVAAEGLLLGLARYRTRITVDH